MAKLQLYLAALSSQITRGMFWDFLPLLVVFAALLFWLRRGSRAREGRRRALLGLLLLLAAVFLDWTDEIPALNLTPLLGRASLWHEPVEDLFYLFGLAVFLSHWKSLVRYR